MNKHLSVSEAVETFGVSRASIFRYMKAGRLQPYHRPMDRKTYIDAAELKALLEIRPKVGRSQSVTGPHTSGMS